MIRLLLVASIALLAGAQPVLVIVKPISFVTTRKALGGGKSAGLWKLSACTDTNQRWVTYRPWLLQIAPNVADLPNDLAEDVIGRNVATNAKSFIGANGDSVLGFASQALAIGGFATGTNPVTYAGLGLAGLQWAFRLIAKQAPDATPYFSRLLPDQVVIPAAGCTPEYYFFASPVHKAAAIVGRISIPVAQ